MDLQAIPVGPLCRCQGIEGPVAAVRSVLLRRRDIRHAGERPPNLRAAFNHAERALFATKINHDGEVVEDEDALYYAIVDVAVAALAILDHLKRPGP